VFRSVLTEGALNSGVHYWEIIPLPFSKNDGKFGVSLKKEFDYDSAFSDYVFGFAFYGNGSLRNGPANENREYGKKLKGNWTLGVLLDMEKGCLVFSFNGESAGPAFSSDQLRKGPIWPAVSLLHQAGYETKFGLPVPAWYWKRA
jgi:hypothetical protein